MNLKRALYVLWHWEQWHYNVKYVLFSPAWLWYSLRAGSFYFFAPANPTLTFGGFEGGPKKEIYESLPEGTYPRSIFIEPSLKIEKVLQMMAEQQVTFPVAVKPNIGMMGLMFRKIDNKEELALYHQLINVEYMVQELVEYPLEVSVFYYRNPASSKGTITGFVKKEALEVTGDGINTLAILMQQQLNNRPGFKYDEWSVKHQARLHEVVPAGEIFKLSYVANLSRGARLISLEHEKDEKLLKVFDDLSLASTHLYYGRYDIKCASIDDLKERKNFKILEFSGTGAEPHHVYGNGNSLLQAFKIINHHWNVLYSIARYHKRRGVKYPSLKAGIYFTQTSNRHFNHLRSLDKIVPVFH